MAVIAVTWGLHVAQPAWLLAAVLVVPMWAIARRNLASLNPVRRYAALVLRSLTILILVALLARLVRIDRADQLTVIAVLDRSQSIPTLKPSLDFLAQAIAKKKRTDQLAVVDVAEAAGIAKLAGGDTEIQQRNTTLTGRQSALADGIQMALAIAPPNTAVRIVLSTDGNQNVGDLKEAARTAAVNHIPIDVLPIRYRYDNEVILRRLVVPVQARKGQTVSVRFVLESTVETQGQLRLLVNGEPVDLDPDGPQMTAPVTLRRGTNVQTLSLPMTTSGVHQLEAFFVPDDPNQDKITQNNRASAVTFVAGPGHILIVDADGTAAGPLRQAVAGVDMDVRYQQASQFPDALSGLMDVDAVVLVDASSSALTFQQQQMLARYVTDLGGGLVMVGGPNAFGAGGWNGSPVAEILPVDLDPPQKKQLPKGALVLIMHACEMPQGNYWGKKVAVAAVGVLSRQDLAGILSYAWKDANDWVWPLSEVGDKKAITAAVEQMQMGDMPDLGAHLQRAYDALKAADAAVKHVIVISDGDPQPPTTQLLDRMKQAGITCTGVAIFPHNPNDINNLVRVAQLTGGRFYHVQDPQLLPQVFAKEAQVVKRPLILEETFVPQVDFSLSEILTGLQIPLPSLDGYVITGPKEGLAQVVLSSQQRDPVLASAQSGLGRCVAFTSSVDSRWASRWLAWPQNVRFWEQVIRWAARPVQSADWEVLSDVQGRRVDLHVEAALGREGASPATEVQAQVIGPDLASRTLSLDPIGPGQYNGRFEAGPSGSYIVHLRYRKGTDSQVHQMQAAVTVPFSPEFADMTDNMPLLTEVASISGGRILEGDPNQVDLFDAAGTQFPVTSRPLTQPLMILWLAVFLLDVAVRRLAVDVRAMARKVLAWFAPRRRGDTQEQTLERLQQTHERMRKQLSRSDAAAAARRFEATDQDRTELPKTQAPEPAMPRPAPKEEEKPAAAPKDAIASHIDQLLKAKRKAQGHQ